MEIKINCESEQSVKLQDLVPFQGDLKKRKQADVQQLCQSLIQEGLMAPFFVWEHDNKKFILDGHGRLEALTSIAMINPEVMDQDYPCVFIRAETEEEARKALLQITSQYGKITKAGLKHFTATIPQYKAAPVTKKLSTFTLSTKNVKANVADETSCVIKIRVVKDAKEEVLNILKNVPFIEVI